MGQPLPTFRKSESMRDGFSRIARRWVEDALRAIHQPSADRAEDIHRVRVAIKRLRALLRLFRTTLPNGLYERENRRLCATARRLSTFRDSSVALDTLKAWQKRVRHPDEQIALAHARQRLEQKLTPAHLPSHSRDAALRRCAAELTACGQRLAPVALSDPDWQGLQPGLIESYKQAKRAMKRAVNSEKEEAFHEWRKRCKDLVYHLQCFEPAWPKELRSMIRQLNRLQTLIGQDHDLVLVSSFLKSELLESDRDRSRQITKRMRKYCEKLRRRSVHLGTELFDRGSRQFSRQLRQHWNTWRRPKS